MFENSGVFDLCGSRNDIWSVVVSIAKVSAWSDGASRFFTTYPFVPDPRGVCSPIPLYMIVGGTSSKSGSV